MQRCVLRGVPAPATIDDILAGLRVAGHPDARIFRYTNHKTSWRGDEYATGTVTIYYTGCAKWLSHIEVLYKRVRIFPEGACFNCEQLNHRSKDCGKHDKRKPHSIDTEPSLDPSKRPRDSTSSSPHIPMPPAQIREPSESPVPPLAATAVHTTSDIMETEGEDSSSSDESHGPESTSSSPGHPGNSSPHIC